MKLDFQALFATAADGLFVLDASLVIVEVNDAFAALVGVSRASMLGRNVTEYIQKEDLRLYPPQTETVAREGSAITMRVFQRADGSAVEGEVTATRLPGGGMMCVVRDVRRRAVVSALRDSEARYRRLFEVTPLPAWVYDVETYRFLAVNPAAIAHYGYTEEQFLSMSILDIRPLEDVERAKAQVQARRSGFEGQGRGWGYRHRRADGTIMDVEIISYAFNFEGHDARIVLVNDVTEQTRLRVREREMEQQLLHAQKLEAVGRLAGGVAHDFNNLLTVVMSATEALAGELAVDSRLRDEVADIRQAVERGAALTRQLLAFGRKEVHAPQLLDVDEVVANVERLLSRALGSDVRLEMRRGAGDMRVMADASQLEQVLVNLAINARDAMPRGGSLVIGTGTRSLDATGATALGLAAGDYVTLEVSDDGIGMDETTRSRAFEPFFTTKGPLEGTGLGLSTVYGIARQSGGAVTIASAPGEGTRVTILLPASNRSSTEASASDRVENGHAPVGVAVAGCVLLVEDEPQVRTQARRLLERSGYRVLEAPDGAEGLRQFRAHHAEIDAIVSDVVMPVLGGVEMVVRARALVPDVPVVFVSGFTAEDRDLPLDARTVFVPKPYSMASLCDAIGAAITAAVVG
jgi:PAS domain S-box-containing protein